ncbi:MAG TPA: adenylate/guanylate cyclase domain-containing protein, partial [Saprospiraceae bacterium]|nr:adenylate/guanylate cyclase domain-containing protein [Saprospiraceae bacterium]
MAEQLFRSVSNQAKVAGVCNQIGTLYLRLHNLSKAKDYFNKDLDLIASSPSLDLLKNYYSGIQSFDSARGDWKNAYPNYRKYIIYRDSLENETNTKANMQTVIQYEFDKKEAAAKAEQEKKDIVQRNIRNSIAGGLAGALIFLVVVFRQRNKISKARKRSDELLLNILPSEVAEELKLKGSTDAKQFDEVTVMFTDFKDFTQTSEKLSPAELVELIHECFSEFDKIISTYGLEKIKTIGDSYMCAGGLPVPNKSNASDTVNAAIAICEFMKMKNLKDMKEGRPVFEMRVGCHTGPVVAGIVGIKKFAYDIWGDTVNIASRMESSGEVGYVNISGATYELVKDQFHCEYRGKIQAKNKGEIDMYFVEHI